MRGAQPVHLAGHQIAWLAAAVSAGGIVAPVALMYGLREMRASDVSLLLNAESVFTAILAWFVFKENVDRRVALGMSAIVIGAVILTGSIELQIESFWPALAVLGACFAWALDNNLTRKVSLADATWLAAVKGIAAGVVNLALALAVDAAWPAPRTIAGGMVLGAVSYGLSLTLFIVGLRHLGTARTSAYYSIAPFFGALLALVLGEALTTALLAAGTLMALGVWLHLSECHEHMHVHEALWHDHEHVHDEHHRHEHDEEIPPGTRHRHWHRHEPLAHSHPHYPDAHHQHDH